METYNTDFEAYTPQDCRDVFSLINTRQIIALMFHDDMADLFDFLALPGFQKLHEYQYITESAEHRKLKWYFMNHHGMLLFDEQIHPIDVIPDDWYKYSRMDVTPAIKKQYTQKAMEMYHAWESGTKNLYEKSAAKALEWGKIADFNRINCLVHDVSEELKCLENLCLELKSVSYDCSYIESIQDRYQEKYEDKFKSIGMMLF